MTLGFAALIIFVLYLIDKHELWKVLAKALAKITAVLAAFALLAGVVVSGWYLYESYRTQKREAACVALWDKYDVAPTKEANTEMDKAIQEAIRSGGAHIATHQEICHDNPGAIPESK